MKGMDVDANLVGRWTWNTEDDLSGELLIQPDGEAMRGVLSQEQRDRSIAKSEMRIGDSEQAESILEMVTNLVHAAGGELRRSA